MESRHAVHPEDAKKYTTEQLRKAFLIDNLFSPGQIVMVYSHIDRVITGSAVPLEVLELKGSEEIRASYFLERRELGIINIGEPGIVRTDNQVYELNPRDGLYLGQGTKKIIFESVRKNQPAKFYFLSYPAHKSYPNEKIDISRAEPNQLGTVQDCNKRTIYKYFHPDGVKSCQLVMGMTILEEGSVWNTMPCHTHDRRMEVYLYFGMKDTGRVFHMMGEPNETRHIIMKNDQAVISPSWSIHSGAGTGNYTFIWGMGGENQTFSDMDSVSLDILK